MNESIDAVMSYKLPALKYLDANLHKEVSPPPQGQAGLSPSAAVHKLNSNSVHHKPHFNHVRRNANYFGTHQPHLKSTS
jgi:hypothetical protein